MCPQKECYYALAFPPPSLLVSSVLRKCPTACVSFDFLHFIVVRHTCSLATRNHRLSLVDWITIVKHDWLSDSVKATACSHSACHDIAFRMDKLRRPLRLCKISKLHSIATLFPNCLRLALPVTRQHPRLVNGGLLDLAVRDFRPLIYLPFSRRTYPFTAPIVIPFVKYFCTKGYIIKIGSKVKNNCAACNVFAFESDFSIASLALVTSVFVIKFCKYV